MTQTTDKIAEAAAAYWEQIKHIPKDRWPTALYTAFSDYRGVSHEVYCERLIELALDAALALPEVLRLRQIAQFYALGEATPEQMRSALREFDQLTRTGDE